MHVMECSYPEWADYLIGKELCLLAFVKAGGFTISHSFKNAAIEDC